MASDMKELYSHNTSKGSEKELVLNSVSAAPFTATEPGDRTLG